MSSNAEPLSAEELADWRTRGIAKSEWELRLNATIAQRDAALARLRREINLRIVDYDIHAILIQALEEG